MGDYDVAQINRLKCWGLGMCFLYNRLPISTTNRPWEAPLVPSVKVKPAMKIFKGHGKKGAEPVVAQKYQVPVHQLADKPEPHDPAVTEALRQKLIKYIRDGVPLSAPGLDFESKKDLF